MDLDNMKECKEYELSRKLGMLETNPNNYQFMSDVNIMDILNKTYTTYDENAQYDFDIIALYYCHSKHKHMIKIISTYDDLYVSNNFTYQLPKLHRYGYLMDEIIVNDPDLELRVKKANMQFKRYVIHSIKFREYSDGLSRKLDSSIKINQNLSESENKNKSKLKLVTDDVYEIMRHQFDMILECNFDGVKKFIEDNKRFLIRNGEYDLNDYYTRQEVMEKYKLSNSSAGRIINKLDKHTLKFSGNKLISNNKYDNQLINKVIVLKVELDAYMKSRDLNTVQEIFPNVDVDVNKFNGYFLYSPIMISKSKTNEQKAEYIEKYSTSNYPEYTLAFTWTEIESKLNDVVVILILNKCLVSDNDMAVLEGLSKKYPNITFNDANISLFENKRFYRLSKKKIINK